MTHLTAKRVTRSVSIGRWTVKYERRFRSNLLGRFGGGWNWKLGVQAGGNTMIVNLLVCTLRISRATP